MAASLAAPATASTHQAVPCDCGSLLGCAAAGLDVEVATLLSTGHHEGLEALGEEERTPLLAAAAAGHSAVIRRLVPAGADVNARDASGKSSLHLTAEAGHHEALEALLACSDDLKLELRDSAMNELTAMHLAATNGHAACVGLLLAAGADAVATDKHGRTALHAAALSGSEGVVAALLRSGRAGDVNAADIFRCTALRLTPGAEDKPARAAVAAHLLAAGANPAFKSTSGEGPLSAAATAGCDQVISLLLEHGGGFVAGARDIELVSALRNAVAAGHLSTVRLLLEAGASAASSGSNAANALVVALRSPGSPEILDALLASLTADDIDRAGPTGETALYRAVSAGLKEGSVVRLLEAGADPAVACYGTKTVLMAAAGRACCTSDVMAALLAHKRCPDVNAVGPGGTTALHWAARAGNADALRRLLAAGANPAARKSCGSTVLMEAARANDDGATVRALLASGCAGDTGARDSAGHTALQAAAKSGNGGAIEALMRATPLEVEPAAREMMFEWTIQSRKPQAAVALLSACTSSWLSDVAEPVKVQAFLLAAKTSKQLLEALLGAGLRVDTWPEASETPLMAAAKAGRLDCVEELLRPAHCVAVDAMDSNGQTALFWALQGAKEDVAIRLLEAGASPCVVSSSGVPALVAAVESGGSERVISAMLAAGARASIDAHGRLRTTALLAAVSKGNVDVARCLVAAGADVWAVNSDGLPALTLAACHSRAEELVDVLAPGLGVAHSETQAGFDIAVRAAAEKGRLRLVRMLAARGADVCGKARTGETALFNASAKGRLDVVDMLLRETTATRVLDEPAHNGHTPLLHAAWLGHARVVVRLLRAGAKLASPTTSKLSALALAASTGRATVVKVILASGQGDLDAQDGNGLTPLAAATRAGFPEVVEHLLAAGANPSVVVDIAGSAGLAETKGVLRALELTRGAMEGGSLRFLARKRWERRRALAVWHHAFNS